jgi:hypothetical protein
MDWSAVVRMNAWLDSPERDFDHLEEVVLGALRDVYRGWSAAPDPAEPGRDPMDADSCYALFFNQGSIGHCIEWYARKFYDFGRCVRTITPEDVVALCEVRSGLELLLAGRSDWELEELLEPRKTLDDVFDEVIAPRITTKAAAEALGPRPEPCKLTAYDAWEKYEKVAAEDSRPVPPGHRWWSLVPVATLEHAPDWGGLEHELDWSHW